MDVRRTLAPLARRLRLLVSRGVVRQVAEYSKLQTVQLDLLADEVRAGVERFQNYGLSSHPLPGAEAIVAAVGGSRDHLVAVAVDDRRYRPTDLAPGEVALYTHDGTRITLRIGGVVEVIAATKLRVESPRLECTGEIVDRCDTDGRSMHHMRTLYDTHTHPENDSGGPTDVPNQQTDD